jgi:hypothetical protein
MPQVYEAFPVWVLRHGLPRQGESDWNIMPGSLVVAPKGQPIPLCYDQPLFPQADILVLYRKVVKRMAFTTHLMVALLYSPGKHLGSVYKISQN